MASFITITSLVVGVENDDTSGGNSFGGGASDIWLIEENNPSKKDDSNKGAIKRVVKPSGQCKSSVK